MQSLMDKRKSYDIVNKIKKLAEKDTSFEQELTSLYLCSFKELKEKYATIITSQNLKELSFIIHKYRTTFLMFELDDLSKEIEKSRAILSSGTLYIEELSRIIVNVEQACDDVIEELNQFS